VRSAALSTGVVIGDAPYVIERSAEKSRSAAPGTSVSSCSMVGTKIAFVTRCRSTTSSTSSGANSLTSTVVAAFHSPRNVQPMPPMWNIGNGVMLTVSASNSQSGDDSTAAARFRCVVRTPFGTPVVPEV